MADRPELTEEEANAVIRSNIGYMTGYLDRETGTRVQMLFNAPHPVFGTTWPSPEEAFKMGLEWGARNANKNSQSA